MCQIPISTSPKYYNSTHPIPLITRTTNNFKISPLLHNSCSSSKEVKIYKTINLIVLFNTIKILSSEFTIYIRNYSYIIIQLINKYLCKCLSQYYIIKLIS